MDNNILDDSSSYQPHFKQIQPYLQTGEELIWIGQPIQGFLLRPLDLFLIIFSLVGGIIFLWGMTFINDNIDLLFLILGIPFGLLVIYIFVRFFANAYSRKNTIYSISNKQIFIKRKEEIITLPLNHIFDIEMIENNKQRGNLYFKKGENVTLEHLRTSFEDIDQVRMVFNLIKPLTNAT